MNVRAVVRNASRQSICVTSRAFPLSSRENDHFGAFGSASFCGSRVLPIVPKV
jgi:hypothetical protein